MSNLFDEGRDSLSGFHEGDMHDAHHVSGGEASADAAELTHGTRLGGDVLEEDSLKMWWRRIHQYPLLTAEREIELAKRIEQDDEAARVEMINSNLRLVGSIARKCRRHAGNALSLADLIQEGSFGLMKAVRKYDYRKGFKFSTYASYWIRQAVMRSIDEQSRSIRLPVHMVESVSRTDRARATLTQELHRPPTERELADHLKISENKVQDITDKVNEPISLDMAMGDEEDSVLVDFIEDKSAPSPVDCASRAALREELERSFDCLSARETEVLRLRYGMDGTGHQRTLDEVGAMLGLTRERIRQIEKVAIKRLKRLGPLRDTAHGSGIGSMIIGRTTNPESRRSSSPPTGTKPNGKPGVSSSTPSPLKPTDSPSNNSTAHNGLHNNESHDNAAQNGAAHGVIEQQAARQRAQQNPPQNGSAPEQP
ncbi:MAG TPA: sigma-70 family RNA polymerase sigma factor [Abditibacteriaceae bacterium]|jgi:RNA polymerase primary sigma factor